MALLPAPRLPKTVHNVLNALFGHLAQGSQGRSSWPAWFAAFLRKAPEALLYLPIAVLLQPRALWRVRAFLSVSTYSLALELLRPLQGRAFQGVDTGYEAVAALVAAHMHPWFILHTVTGSDRAA
jgi:hypothetical protein